MTKKISRFQKLRASTLALLDENTLHSEDKTSRWERFAHFWILVWRSFVRNRCPIRASALAYATLLALIPMLAVVMSITSSFLKQEGEERIDQFIVKLVASVTPQATLSTNVPAATASQISSPAGDGAEGDQKREAIATDSTLSGETNRTSTTAASSLVEDERVVAARKSVARKINEYVQNTRSGALGVTGSFLLIFAAISMLSRIEATFNDIWGVVRGRTWFMRIVLYWGVLSLVPLLVVVALGLATGPHFESTKHFLTGFPLVGGFLFHFGFQFLPIVVLCLTFGTFYMLMPNCKVRWSAALVGGSAAGILCL
jgi:membrane protein